MVAGENGGAHPSVVDSNAGSDFVPAPSLFRLMKLVHETQCEMEIVKPVLDELEVMRLCRFFGTMSSVNPKDFNFDILHAREFDDDFIRFLRFDLLENSCPGDLRLKGLFGKQAQIANALVDMTTCSVETIASLTLDNEGIYCMKMDDDCFNNECEDTKTFGLVVFSWIRDELFQSDGLRDTPAFILRFLTVLVPDIICCTTEADTQQLKVAMMDSDTQEDDEFSSYSVSFHIEKQEDQSDAVAVKKMMKSSIHYERVQRTFWPNMELTFAKWLKKQSQQYRIDLSGSIVQSAKLCQNILQAFDMWPEDEIRASRCAYEKQHHEEYDKAADQLKAEITQQRAVVEQISNGLFELRPIGPLSENAAASLQTAWTAYDAFRGWLKSACTWKFDQKLNFVLDAPARLKEINTVLFSLYSHGQDRQLRSLLEMCSTVSKAELLTKIKAYQKANKQHVGSKKSDEDDKEREVTWESFLEIIAEPLTALHTKWLNAVESGLAAALEVKLKKLKNGQKRKKTGTREVHSPLTAFLDIVKLDAADTPEGRPGDGVVRQKPLGRLRLYPNEYQVAIFTVKVRSAVQVCTNKECMRTKFIYFQPNDDCRQPPRAKEQIIRTFGQVASLCDYNARTRIMTFLSKDSVGLYKFDEAFKNMELVKVIDLGVRSTLTELPFTDILLQDTSMYVTDSSVCTQAIDIHNDQTSNILNMHASPEMNSSSSKMFELADNLTIGAISLVPSNDGSFVGELECISRDDHRHLPALQLGVIFLTDRVSVQCFNDRVLVLDPLVQKHWLYTFYHVFEKFPVRGLLDSISPTHVSVTISSIVSDGDVSALETYHDFLSLLMSDLMALNKPLHGLDLTHGLVVLRSLRGVAMETRSLEFFFRTLITFLPIQICRAEGNALTILHDGVDQSLNEAEVEVQTWGAADIAESIRFGLLSPLLCAWRDRCIVITSMGKQSTGKSYFLNHLTGSSFAIAGNRCTDGAWMSLRIMEDVMLVVLDFEGLGSFERTDQEDVFLSVLNASLSMFTIFRMEMRFDKDIDALFTKFQKGINLLKNDERLFQGSLYMSVKDVNPNDRHGVLTEFQQKFQKLLTANREQNFLTELYSGRLGINCSPPLGTLGYYHSLRHASKLIDELVNGEALPSGFKSGSSFHDCIRLVLAKISILDWTAVDEISQRLEMNDLHRKLPGVIRSGCLIPADCQTKRESIPQTLKDPILFYESDRSLFILEQLSHDYPEFVDCWASVNREIFLDEIDDEDVDFGFSVCSDSCTDTSSIHFTLLALFHRYLALTSKGALEKITDRDYASFDALLSFLIYRRKTKVILWVKQFLGPERFMDEWEKIEQNYLLPFESLLKRCLHGCSNCQLQCMRSSYHSFDEVHDCGMSHVCRGLCEHCMKKCYYNQTGTEIPRCVGKAGHEGACDCLKGDHTCGAGCGLSGASNCGGVCQTDAAAEISHCRGEITHLCNSRHTCNATCETEGICSKLVQVSTKTFSGTCDTFDFELKEMVSVRNKCVIVLNPGQTNHSGVAHSCIKLLPNGSSTVHGCGVKCTACEYYCEKPVGHEGEHSAAHGNMRNMHFITSTHDSVINWEDHKYATGEKGVAEMCNMYCSSAGRGHVHYLKCDKDSSATCTYHGGGDQRRHCKSELKPKPTHEVDEVLHTKYWKTVGWEDPCRSAAERLEFTRCPYMCDAPEHKGEGKVASFCDLEVWHHPVTTPPLSERRGFSYVSGHRFSCSHTASTGKVHHVFVLDCSGSMRGEPWQNLVSGVRGYLRSRCVRGASEDIVSVVTFGNQGIIEFEAVPINSARGMNIVFHGGGTFYSNGLSQASAIFSRTDLSEFTPVMISSPTAVLRIARRAPRWRSTSAIAMQSSVQVEVVKLLAPSVAPLPSCNFWWLSPPGAGHLSSYPDDDDAVGGQVPADVAGGAGLPPGGDDAADEPVALVGPAAPARVRAVGRGQEDAHHGAAARAVRRRRAQGAARAQGVQGAGPQRQSGDHDRGQQLPHRDEPVGRGLERPPRGAASA
ncbi:unnamed protein product [Phytophthora fragariaefolia]|uniref:Unnamed protein product n=1 Tax=Phytophthora fragariaefolia TaxID=1490495 RepID=A0A9W6WTP9_9STRA|nr:unnamed protein product [Phytophthora fragariaefolia]